MKVSTVSAAEMDSKSYPQFVSNVNVKERTAYQQVNFCIEWTVEDFSTYQMNSETMFSVGISLSDLGLGGHNGRWRLGVVPCHRPVAKDNNVEMKYLSVYLHLTDEDPQSSNYTGKGKFTVKHKFRSTTGRAGSVAPISTWDVWSAVEPFSSQSSFRGYAKYFLHEVLFGSGSKSGCLKDDTIGFSVEVQMYTTEKSEVVHISKTTFSDTPDPDISLKQAMRRLSDFARSSSHQHSRNFCIQSSDGMEFHADKLVLMAHSSVFKSMLSHDSTEKMTGRCEMSDVDGESVEILLDYLYGCETGKITSVNVEKVLAVADKYQIVDLLSFCEKTLSSTITIETAAHCLVMADQRGLRSLKQAVLNFINHSNMAAVFAGEAIIKVAQQDPQLIQTVMEYCATKPPR